MKQESFTFKAGTKLSIGEHVITLTEDSEMFFDGAGNEAQLVGILTLSKNLQVNAPQLEKSYNGFGMEIPGADEKVQEPSAAEEKRVEQEFERTQENQTNQANGLPSEPLDRDVVPSQQRAPVLGSPELKDVEKMNNMEQIPSFQGFAPLASQPDGKTDAPPVVNDAPENLVQNGAFTDRSNINGAPNTAIADAKAKAEPKADGKTARKTARKTAAKPKTAKKAE